MKGRMGGIRKAKMNEKLRSVSNGKTLEQDNEDKVIDWTSLYRSNWDIYAEFHLGIPLKPYQRVALHEIGASDVYFWRAGRGGAKSFITACAALCKLMLYPNCWIVVTASTIDQANKIVEDKIERELIKKLSPYLLYLYEKQYLVITKPTDGYKIENTLNNSVLRVLAPVESSRGARSNFTIYDEIAIMKKASLDQIFDGMLFPRQAEYLNLPEYAGKSRWVEESKSIYLTSSKYKYQWWYRLWKDCVTGYFTDKKTKYNMFATDFFDNIANGLKTWGDYRRAKRVNNDFDFRMEYLNEAIGEAEDAFFTIQSFKDNQTLPKAFTPPTSMDVYMGNDLGNKPKEEDELRLVIVDYAFTNTTSREKNDNTIIMCMSLHWKKNRFERHVDYMEGWPASDSIGANNRAREIWWDYGADYLIPDQRAGGEVLYNRMTEVWENEERGKNWNPHGFTVCDKMQYHVVPESKIKDLKERTVDTQAIPCIIPMISTSEINSLCWIELKKQLECGNIKFLISMQDRQEAIEDDGSFFQMTSEELAKELAPYGQVDLLIQEAINLKTEIRNDKIKLVEPRSGTKDRAIVLSYGNYIASLIENEWNKQTQIEEIDVSQIQLVW